MVGVSDKVVVVRLGGAPQVVVAAVAQEITHLLPLAVEAEVLAGTQMLAVEAVAQVAQIGAQAQPIRHTQQRHHLLIGKGKQVYWVKGAIASKKDTMVGFT